jgi:D-tyrosyl-tRNA(Tyr) deacylase
MVIVVQRVLEASVTVNERTVGAIKAGLLLLVGIAEGDAPIHADSLAKQIAKLRIFEDVNGKMSVDIADAGGAILVVSQFTLLADFTKGNRPSFHKAARPENARPLFDAFIESLRRETRVPISTGEFGADMKVQLVNDGPVTFVLES